LGTAAIPVILTVLLVVVAWRVVFGFNKDLVRAGAWGELARRSLPFAAITLMAASLPLVQERGGSIPIIWAIFFGVILILSRFVSEPAEERRASRAFRQGDYEDAASLYRKLAEERPLARHYAFLGAALGAGGHHEEALEASSKATELDPQYGIAYYNRALILRNTGRRSRAIKDLKKALEADLPRRFKSAANNVLAEMQKK
jgi:tetratricopeptide (TPR) repeat protein